MLETQALLSEKKSNQKKSNKSSKSMLKRQNCIKVGIKVLARSKEKKQQIVQNNMDDYHF